MDHIPKIKYFKETDSKPLNFCDDEWRENDYRMIFLECYHDTMKMFNYLREEIIRDPSKDILAIRFPCDTKSNPIQRFWYDIKNGKGFKCKSVWYPKEIWIYCSDDDFGFCR